MSSLKQQTRNLYRLCFDDDEAFADAYFEYLYSHDRNVTILRKGEVVSAMQIIPVSIHLSNYTTEGARSGYISGACTHPAYRGKGLMRILLERALRKMYKAGDQFATLIPANESLFGYYAGSGFVRCFDYSVETTKPTFALQPGYEPKTSQPARSSIRWNYEPVETVPETLIYTLLELPDYPFYSQYIHQRRNYQGYQFYFGNFEKLVEKDMELYGGKTWIVTTPDHLLVGHAICYPQEKQLFIPSVTADNADTRRHLIRCMENHYKLPETLIATEPEKQPDALHLGMARIVNAFKLLCRYAEEHPGLHAEFTLSDPLIPENNGTYSLPGTGKILYSRKNTRTEVTVEQLTQAILGYHPEQLPGDLSRFPKGLPYMHLMLN